MLLLRKIIFYIFAAVYVVACPLVIAYALGYMFVPQQRNVIQTGLISLQTFPQGAAVYLDGELFPQPTPVVIPEITPGPHGLRIVLPGHREWRRQVTVRSGEAVAFEHIVMLPHEPQVEELTQESYRRARQVPGRDELVLSRDGYIREVFRMDDRRILSLREAATHKRRRPVTLIPVPFGGPAMRVAFRWIYEQGRSIGQCFLSVGGDHLVFREGNAVYFIRTDPAVDPLPCLLTLVQANSDMLYDGRQGVVYYLSAGSGRLNALHVLASGGQPLRRLFDDFAGTLEQEH